MKQQNKGTGKWTSQSSLDLGEPLSPITESVCSLYSSLKDQRAASKVLMVRRLSRSVIKLNLSKKFVARCTSVKSFPMLRASPSCVLQMNTTGILTTARSAKIFPRWLHHSCAVPAKDHRCLCAKRWHCLTFLLAPYFKQIADDYP